MVLEFRSCKTYLSFRNYQIIKVIELSKLGRPIYPIVLIDTHSMEL